MKVKFTKFYYEISSLDEESERLYKISREHDKHFLENIGSGDCTGNADGYYVHKPGEVCENCGFVVRGNEQ